MIMKELLMTIIKWRCHELIFLGSQRFENEDDTIYKFLWHHIKHVMILIQTKMFLILLLHGNVKYK